MCWSLFHIRQYYPGLPLQSRDPHSTGPDLRHVHFHFGEFLEISKYELRKFPLWFPATFHDHMIMRVSERACLLLQND